MAVGESSGYSNPRRSSCYGARRFISSMPNLGTYAAYRKPVVPRPISAIFDDLHDAAFLIGLMAVAAVRRLQRTSHDVIAKATAVMGRQLLSRMFGCQKADCGLH